MIFEYRIIPRDFVYLNYNIVGDQHLKRLRGSMRFTPLLLIFVIILFQFREGVVITPPLIVLISVLGILYILWIKNSNKILDKISEKRLEKIFNSEENQWLKNERTMEIKEDRVIETIEYLNGLENKELLNMTYDDFFTVDKSKEGIYLFINDQSAYIIPNRAFKDENEMNEVYNYIYTKVEEAIEENNTIYLAEENKDDINSRKTLVTEEDKVDRL